MVLFDLLKQRKIKKLEEDLKEMKENLPELKANFDYLGEYLDRLTNGEDDENTLEGFL